MKKNNTITLADLANMMTAMQNDCARIADVCVSLDARLTALEKGATKSAKASKPVAQKSKTSEDPSPVRVVRVGTTEPKWVLDKKCVYSVPNAWISKNARYAFKMQAQEAGGEALTDTEREALVKKLGDKYVSARKFKTEKAAKAFFAKWMA